MNSWTMQDVKNFDAWLRERGGQVNYPVQETFNGQYIIPMNEPKGMTGQEAVDTYDKEVVNA